jgi:hypothetical protein
MPKRLPLGAVVTAWLILALVSGLTWLVTNYPSQRTQSVAPDNCKTITQGQNGPESQNSINNDRQLAEYTCQLAVYTAQLAKFTEWLVVVTVAVMFVGVWQGRQLWHHARIAERTLFDLERAYISGGGIRQRYEQFVDDETRLMLTGDFQMHINNYGRTPAELTKIEYGIIEWTEPIPATPLYQRQARFRTWIEPQRASTAILTVPVGTQQVTIFGRFYYRDVVRKGYFSSGFIHLLRPWQEGGSSEHINAPSAYTEEREETEESAT